MSRTANNATRCDWCGRLSRNQLGEYAKPDGTVGYIHAPDWAKDGWRDVCEECAADRCPHCGCNQVVRITPSIPGPDGWGWRCRACERDWYLQPIPANILGDPGEPPEDLDA